MCHASLRKTALYAALVSLGLAMSAMAQTPGTSTPGTTGKPTTTTGAGTMPTDKPATHGASEAKLAHGDRKFIEEAAKGGMAEVQLGQLAVQKAQSPEVKQFAQKMVDDHTKANDELKQVASSKGVELPTDLDHSAKREHDKLSKLSGADFDREYMNHMVSDHKKDVKAFKDESKSAKDAQVKEFATTTLPTLEQHLQLAEQTDAAVRSASRSTNTAHTSATTSGGTTSAGTNTGAMPPGKSSTTSGASTSRKSGT
jgi:putative membrane protein